MKDKTRIRNNKYLSIKNYAGPNWDSGEPKIP